MTDTTFVDRQAPTIKASWLNDINKAVYRAIGAGGVAPVTPANVLTNLGITAGGASLVGYVGPGGFLRTVASKELDQVSVMDFGALGDGTTDDTVAIAAASLYCRTAGKSLYFPTPAAFYKTTAAISLGDSSHWFGENGGTTCIRRTSGSGHVLETLGYGSLGPYLLENLKIGGGGCVGIASLVTTLTGTVAGNTLTVNAALTGNLYIGDSITGPGLTGCKITAGAGSSWTISGSPQTVGPILITASYEYTARLEMYNVNFEGDLLTGMDVNAIYMTAFQCSFGYYTQTATNAAFVALKSNGNGALNSNLNVMERCAFFNGQTGYTVQLSSGILWRFTECDWEGNVHNLSTLDVQNVLLEQCYTERVTASALSFAFNFSTARTKVVVKGGYFTSATMVATAAMFGMSDTVDVIVEDADIIVTASATAYFNSTTTSRTPGGHHHFKDCRIAGNSSDPILWMDSKLEGNPVAWTPTPVGLTVVLGGGTATYAGTWTLLGNRAVNFTISLSIAAPATAASVIGTTYFQLPTQFVPTASQVCLAFNGDTPAGLGQGIVRTNGRVYLPAWAAQSGTITVSGQFNF